MAVVLEIPHLDHGFEPPLTVAPHTPSVAMELSRNLPAYKFPAGSTLVSSSAELINQLVNLISRKKLKPCEICVGKGIFGYIHSSDNPHIWIHGP